MRGKRPTLNLLHDLAQVWLEGARATVGKGREVWLLKLAGVDSPEAAERLRGLFLLGDAASRPALEGDDEFYVQARAAVLPVSPAPRRNCRGRPKRGRSALP